MILDSGLQVNFVTDAFINKLKVKRKSCNSLITGIGEVTTNSQQFVSLSIASRVSNFNTQLDFLVLPKITNRLPLKSFDFDKSKLPIDFELADPYFKKMDKIDILIGTEQYHEIVLGERVNIISELPPFQKSQFGYIISGKIESNTELSSGVCYV